MTTRKGQTQITFHWIYVVIAGALILLFFIGIVVQQQRSASEQLQSDILRSVESILTAAGVSKNTRDSLDISALDNSVFSFTCTEGTSEITISGSSQVLQNSIDPLFAPGTISASRLIVWNMPFQLPYPLPDFLFVTSPNIEYVFLQESSFDSSADSSAGAQYSPREGSNYFADNFADEFLRLTQEEKQEWWIQRSVVSDISQFLPSVRHTRLIDIQGTEIAAESIVPTSLQKLPDGAISAVVFQGKDHVQYFRKAGAVWKAQGKPLLLFSLGEKRDASRYAAVFSENGDLYQCSLQKVLNRLELLQEIYTEKIHQLQEFYSSSPEYALSEHPCYMLAFSGENSSGQENLPALQEGLGLAIKACSLALREGIGADSCITVVDFAQKIQAVNLALEENACITIY